MARTRPAVLHRRYPFTLPFYGTIVAGGLRFGLNRDVRVCVTLA